MKLALALALLAVPHAFTQPTSISLERSGALLVVENDPGRVLRFDPAAHRVTVLAAGLDRPYSVAESAAGAIYVSAGPKVIRIAPRRAVVYRGDVDVGPLALSRSGAVLFATAESVFRLTAGGRARRIASGLAAPHGLAALDDGSVLVSDTGHNRVLRIAPHGGATVFAHVGSPRGISVAHDGSVLVVDSVARRVVRVGHGRVGPAFLDPYAVAAAANGAFYVLEAPPFGEIIRVGADGKARAL